jgi:2-polyprenyl-3-methyl-5-hydroxy-6-metoxy-1,4-benzoquinol methylase
MIFSDLKTQCPHFVAVADHLERTFALFMTKPLEQLRASNPDYALCEKICSDAYALSGNDERVVFERAETLVDFSMEFVQLQRELERTGHYLYSTFGEVDEHVYKNPELTAYGPPYVWAMYFTQAFWVTHCRLWRFFMSDFARTGVPSGRVLEIPSGNGLFLTHFLLSNPTWRGVGLDLSEASISFTDRVTTLNGVRERVELVHQDFFLHPEGDKLDRIICGEFLEHVEKPQLVLEKLRRLVKPEGRVFLTAAVWAANIDHIYLYESAEQVREHVRAAGFEMENELVQNVFAGKGPEDARTPINYSAILRPR